MTIRDQLLAQRNHPFREAVLGLLVECGLFGNTLGELFGLGRSSVLANGNWQIVQ